MVRWRITVLLLSLGVLFGSCSTGTTVAEQKYFDAFVDSRSYPLKMWMGDDFALRSLTESTMEYWEGKLFGDSAHSTISIFVPDKQGADLIIASGSYISVLDEQGRRITSCALSVFLRPLTGRVCESTRQGQSAIVLLDPKISREQKLSVLQHELGHAIFGLLHNWDRKSIMYPYIQESSGEVTAQDIATATEYLRNHGVSVP